MTQAVKRLHLKYDSAIFVKTGTIIESTYVTDDGDLEVLELEMKGVTVASVNKPPVGAFCMHTQRTSKPQIFIGDLISLIINWRCYKFIWMEMQ